MFFMNFYLFLSKFLQKQEDEFERRLQIATLLTTIVIKTQRGGGVGGVILLFNSQWVVFKYHVY